MVPIAKWLGLFWFGFNAAVLSAQIPDLQLTVRYNPTFTRYEVFALPNASQSVFNWGPSQISVVLPASVPDEALTIVSVAGGSWQDNSRIYAPLVMPGKDFHGIGTLGATTSLIQNVEKMIFYFTLPGGGCTPGVRLFINNVDPGSSAPGMNGGDFANTIFAIVPGVPDGYEAYTGNYNNTGTICSSVPLELVAFDGEARQNSITLTWKSTNEVNLSHFELERSVNGIDFTTLEHIQPQWTPSYNDYSYNDEGVKPGVLYCYRLKMVDLDGRFAYSGLIKKGIDHVFFIQSISPNPARDQCFLTFSAAAEHLVSVALFDVNGILLEQQEWACFKGENQKIITLNKYPSGIYIMALTLGEDKILAKVIKASE